MMPQFETQSWKLSYILLPALSFTGVRSFKANCWAYTSPGGMPDRILKAVRVMSHVLTMPQFNLEELQQLWRVVKVFNEGVPKPWVHALYALAGGNARVVLEMPTFSGLMLRDMELYASISCKVSSLDAAQSRCVWGGEVSPLVVNSLC